MDIHEVIAAFADGERVDGDQLERALADAAGRANLLDLLALRGLVGEQTSHEVLAVPVATPAEPRRPVARLFAVAASILLLVARGFAGFVAGHRVAAALDPAAPAAPQQIVLPDTQICAPAPPRVIQVEPGVDWKQSAGGN